MDFRKTFDKIPERFDKYSCYKNFHIVNADFENYIFEENKYDLVYSAATIQWIPEEIAFTKIFQMLKPGGYLAMFMTRSDERSANPSLKDEINNVYNKFFHVEQKYNCRMQYEIVITDTIPLYLVQKPL